MTFHEIEKVDKFQKHCQIYISINFVNIGTNICQLVFPKLANLQLLRNSERDDGRLHSRADLLALLCTRHPRGPERKPRSSIAFIPGEITEFKRPPSTGGILRTVGRLALQQAASRFHKGGEGRHRSRLLRRAIFVRGTPERVRAPLAHLRRGA